MASNETNFQTGERVFFKDDKSCERPYIVQGKADNGPGYAVQWVILIKGNDGKQIEVEPSRIRKEKPPKNEHTLPKNTVAPQHKCSSGGSEIAPPQSQRVPVQQRPPQLAIPHLPLSETFSAEGSQPMTFAAGKESEPLQTTLSDAYKVIRQVLRRVNDLPEAITQGFGVALDHRDQELEARSHISDLIKQFSLDFADKAGVEHPDPIEGNDPTQQALGSLRQLRMTVLNYAAEQDIQKKAQDIQKKALDRRIQILKADADALRAQESQWVSDKSTLAAQYEQMKMEHRETEERFQRLGQQMHSQRQTEQQEIGGGLMTFWESREKFYRGLHRGILAEKEGDERKRLRNRREENLKADIALLERLGCQMSFVQEALSFSRVAYDGSLHHWHEDRDDPVSNGQQATVFLPGWRLGDAEFKPSFGGQEIAE